MAKTDYKVSELVAKIRQGELQLPEMQRRYVWTSTKVRDLLDSLYRGYPSGVILAWQGRHDQWHAGPRRDCADRRRMGVHGAHVREGSWRNALPACPLRPGSADARHGQMAGAGRVAAERQGTTMDQARHRGDAQPAELWSPHRIPLTGNPGL